MKKIISLLLILALAMSLVACGADTTPETTNAPETTAAPDTTPDTTGASTTAGAAVTSISMNSGEYYLTAFDNGDGTTYVEMATAERKVGNLEGDVFAKITEAVNAANLAALNGTEIYEEGEAYASMYMSLPTATTTAPTSTVLPMLTSTQLSPLWKPASLS